MVCNLWKVVMAVMLMCLMVSCSSVKWARIDRLSPAKISLSEKVRRVAVLNNQRQVSNQNSNYSLDSKEMVDSLAQYLADVAYFDEVVVCDTVLSSNWLMDAESRELRPVVVAELCKTLGVDMLVTVDNIAFNPDAVSHPFVTGVLTVRVKCYQQGEVKPLLTISEECWFDWNHWLILKDDAIFQASMMVLPTIVPHWTIEELPFYTGANVVQRDAAVYVREGNWDGAASLWRQQLSHKNLRRRMEAHLNMAVYHEVKDADIAIARDYVKKALDLATEKNKKKKKNADSSSYDFQLISDYRKDMELRGRKLEQLKQQMRRFSNDF